MSRRRFLANTAASLAGCGLASHLAWAQGSSSQLVRLIVPFTPGSATDNIARLLMREMQLALDRPIVVDNRPGAQGSVGADVVAHSAPDGSTLLVAAVSFAATPSTFKHAQFDPVADFKAICIFASTPLVLVVRSDFAAASVDSLIEYGRAHPGKMSAGYGSSSSQVCAAQFARAARIDVLQVPYKSIPLAMNDMLGGTLQFTFLDLGNALAQVKSGRMRALGVTTGQRSPLVPDWPALPAALPQFEPIDAWIGLMGPKGLSDPVSHRLYRSIERAVADPAVKERLALQGFVPALKDPGASGTFVKDEVEKWSRLYKQAGIQPE